VADILKKALPVGLVALASAWICQMANGVGDYSVGAAPAVDALAAGRIGDFLSTQPLMGPFSILVRAPFVAIAGGGQLADYRVGAFPCVFAVGLLGLYLASIAARRGMGRLGQFAIVALCLFNPITFNALWNGHPEEILTAALAVGAVVVASQGHRGRAALLLGLALATKQTAVIAILPVLMALPDRQLRVGAGAIAIAFALVVPGFLAAPSEFTEMQGNAATPHRIVSPWSVWYAAIPETTQEVDVGGQPVAVRWRRIPEALGRASHPLIIALAFLLPVLLALRRRRFHLSGPDALALFALLCLLRAGLDHVSNLYYHEPLLLALIAWDAMSARALPVRGLAATAVALALEHWGIRLADPLVFNAFYIAAFTAGVSAIAYALSRRGLPRRVATVRPPVAAQASSG